MKSKTNLSYEELWNKFSKGDMLAFRKIYIDFYPELYNFGLLYLKKNEVENLIQDTFLYILQRRNALSKVKNVKAYLFTALRNRISKYAKANQYLLDELPVDLIIEENDNYLNELIKLIIYKLSPREREVVHLHYFKNYRNKEIAQTLNIEYQTVRNTLHNAIKKLRVLFLEFEFA